MGGMDFSQDVIEFLGFEPDNQQLSKPEVMGEQLLNKLSERNPRFGGISCGFWGIPGSGKTSLMLQIAEKIMKEHREETIIWREPHSLPMQVTNLGIPVNIFADQKLKLKIYELTKDKPVNTNDINSKVFYRPSSLVKMLQPGINVVYFSQRKQWLSLIKRMQGNLAWQSFFIDEAEDIFSSRASGKDWYLTEEFTTLIKDLRKARVSLYLNSQVDWDVDARVKTKLMLECFLYGSRKDKNTPLYKGVLQDIKLGEAWITYAHALFGKFCFDPVEPLEKQYIALPNRK